MEALKQRLAARVSAIAQGASALQVAVSTALDKESREQAVATLQSRAEHTIKRVQTRASRAAGAGISARPRSQP